MKKYVYSRKSKEEISSDERLILALEKGDKIELETLEIRDLSEKEIQLIATQTMFGFISSNTRKRLLKILEKNELRFAAKS